MAKTTRGRSLSFPRYRDFLLHFFILRRPEKRKLWAQRSSLLIWWPRLIICLIIHDGKSTSTFPRFCSSQNLIGIDTFRRRRGRESQRIFVAFFHSSLLSSFLSSRDYIFSWKFEELESQTKIDVNPIWALMNDSFLRRCINTDPLFWIVWPQRKWHLWKEKG